MKYLKLLCIAVLTLFVVSYVLCKIGYSAFENHPPQMTGYEKEAFDKYKSEMIAVVKEREKLDRKWDAYYNKVMKDRGGWNMVKRQVVDSSGDAPELGIVTGNEALYKEFTFWNTVPESIKRLRDSEYKRLEIQAPVDTYLRWGRRGLYSKNTDVYNAIDSYLGTRSIYIDPGYYKSITYDGYIQRKIRCLSKYGKVKYGLTYLLTGRRSI